MDIVTDLTAEAVSFITLIQDICKSTLPEKFREHPEGFALWEIFDKENLPGKCNPLQRTRVGELIWSSLGTCKYTTLEATFFKSATDLLAWLNEELRPAAAGKANPRQGAHLNATPDFWRQEIRAILYERTGTRISLIQALHYMPLQMVLALKPKKVSLYNQRLYQVFEISENSVLCTNDRELNEAFWSMTPDDIVKRVLAEGENPPTLKAAALLILTADLTLIQLLLERNIALPFDDIFRRELDEISSSRDTRFAELPLKLKIPLPDDDEFVLTAPKINQNANDPQRRAIQMKLAGLAFSGGGIRSATFNLGLLQKLANLGVLGRFDYLSTVSGGGYIGTWFASWVRNAGSLSKVEKRLDPEKSGDPMGDEVRPIRWLRMYSNYLSPNASIMSADAWTMGITWMRNTLINQVILLLLLLTVLGAIGAVYQGWLALSNLQAHANYYRVCLWSTLMLIPGAFMAGIGMRSYNQQRPPQSRVNLWRSDTLPHILVGWTALSACVLSAWFYISLDQVPGLSCKLQLLWPSAGFILLAMIIISWFGGYHLISDSNSVKKKRKQQLIAAIYSSSIAAAVAGYALLAVAWELMYQLSTVEGTIIELPKKLNLIFGVPLILEVISITAVVRMALMGDFFPDERREWWGRLGALVHRFMLFWIIIASCSLILPDYLGEIYKDNIPKLPALLGGWAAIIGAAVKLAYQSSDSDTTKKPGAIDKIKDGFIRLAPYLFMLGFLLIGAAVLNILRDQIGTRLNGIPEAWSCVFITVILMVITALLSSRVGVNEFSLHDFYRNRLVRAYLGGTRRRTDRENTANGFTGFDKDDDHPLALLRAENDYTGPYPLINTALNATVITDLDRQDRKAESFIFSPLFCGFDFNPTRSAAYQHGQSFEYGYRPTEHYSADGGPLAGTAMAISGAAVNPNMGYHSSAATAFLLTIFNVRLGRWIGNPAGSRWHRSDPVAGIGYLVQDLVGKSDISAKYVNLSDGGHFDNMGLYELVRRRCSFIVLGDAEQDTNSSCEGLANAIRRCRIDFGADIRIPGITDITKKDAQGFAEKHIALGTIHYAGQGGLVGKLLYIKTAVTKDLPVDIREYLMNNTEFPQQSTADQFFDEAQFESYRNLGYHSL